MMKKEKTTINKNILRNRYQGAIEFLKKQTVNDKQQLYDLPWHFILSTDKSSKNNLLEQSNLEFVLKKKNDGHSFSHCEWWGTQDNIFVDINQKYCSPSIKKSEQKLWKDFLKITHTAKTNAIHALWLVIDLPTLLLSQQENQTAFCAMLKSRINDLQRYNHATFPIYIIITQVDILKGFIDFFDDLSNKARKQPWGISFKTKHSITTQSIAEHFETEFNHLLENLNQRVITRLHHERNIDKKVNIKDFPLQVESIKKPLAAFLQSLAETITLKNNTALKGLYFVSLNPQPGTEDRLLQPLNKAFDLQPYFANVHLPAQEDYFVKDLLPKVILPDAEYYHINKKPLPKSYHRRFHLLAAVTAATIVLGFSAFFIHDYLSENNMIRQAEVALSQYQVVHDMKNEFDMQYNLIALDKLNTAYQTLEKKSNTHINKLSKSNLSQLENETKQAYTKALTGVINKQLQQIITQQTQAKTINASILYGALKSYLMLTHSRYYDPDYLDKWLLNYWAFNTSMDKKTLARLQVHLTNFIDLYQQQVAPNTTLINTARAKLSQIPTAELINVILENNNNQLPLRLVLNTQNMPYPIFDTKSAYITIPGIYTKAAFEHVYDKVLPQTAKQLQQGDWVTGRQGFIVNVDADTLMQIRKQYINNYIHTWDNVITKLQLAPIDNYQQAIYVMQSLVAPSTLVKNIMKSIYQNTNISYHNSNTPISDHFANLDKIIYLFKHSQNSNLNTIIGALKNIQNSDNQAIAAFEFAKAQLLLKTDANPFSKLQKIADNAPQPIKNWTQSLLKNTWSLILNDSAITINAAWKDSIYSTYQKNLAKHYPFSATASQDAKMHDVDALLSKDGIFNKFYDIYLSTFFEIKNNQLTAKDFYGDTLPLSQQGLANIQKLQQLSQTFYTDDEPAHMHFKFTLAPEKIAGNTKAVDLNLDEQAATYSLQYLTPTQFNWPGKKEQHFASIVFIANSGEEHAITKTGPWAVIKLLSPNKIKVIKKDNKTIETHIMLDNYGLDYALKSLNDLNPFSPGILLDLALDEDIIDNNKITQGST